MTPIDIAPIILVALAIALAAATCFVIYSRIKQHTRERLEGEKEQGEAEEQGVKAEAAQREAERQTQLAAEQAAKDEADRKAQEDAERSVREEAAQREAERQDQLAGEQAAKDEAERKALEDAERKAREEAAQREAERQAQLAAEQAAKEEAGRKAQEDAERKAREEAAQRETERQAQLAAEQTAKEGTERKAQEEAERKAEEAQQEAGGEQRLGAEVETRRVEPVKRGGRLPSSGRVGEAEKSEPSEKRPRVLKPEVVCWKKARNWFVGVETPKEYQDYVGLTITQNGIRLAQDDEGRWILLQTTGTVCISWNEAEHPIEISLDKPYLLFRLVGESINRGRRVRYATVGSFLVVVPEQWQRDEQISGSAPVSPENVATAGHQAHYFLLNREGGGKIGFLSPEGRPEIIPTYASRFELTGTRLPDASENMGPLFAKGPPRILALEQSDWRNVKTIVVGQEGWRIAFTPEQDRNELDFPSELDERRGGWYFVRLYDAEDALAESWDFRFVRSLKDIKISPHSPFPGVNGHSPVEVEFLHDTGCVVELSNPRAESLPVEREDAGTIVTIPPDPIWDETYWMIHVEGEARVQAKILVERVWWAIGEEGVEGESVRWTDAPVSISRDLVTATSKQSIRFRLPRRRWVSEIHVGFEWWKARTYPVEVVKREVTVPLSDFEGVQEIEDQGHEHLLKLWIGETTDQDMPAVVAIIPPTLPLIAPPLPADVYRVRNYLRRLERRAEDAALREIIHKARARWFALVPEVDAGSRRIETACVIALAWEISRANGVKPLGRHKRWIRKLGELALAHPEITQRVREDYETLRRGHIGVASRTKQ
jgi:hypothetical protein